MLPLFAFLKYTLEAPKNKKYSELNIRGAGEKLVELKHINRNVIKAGMFCWYPNGCFHVYIQVMEMIKAVAQALNDYGKPAWL